MSHFLLVGLGGFFGAMLRYGAGLLVFRLAHGTPLFPFATLLVNVVGSFLIGLGATLMMARADAGPELRLFLIVGLLGAFTTFSTFSLDTLNLIESGRVSLGLLNVVLNVVLCLLAVVAGTLLGKWASL